MLSPLQKILEPLQQIWERLRSEKEQNREENRRRQVGVTRAALIPSLGIPLPGSSTIWLVDLAGVWDGVPDYVKMRARGCRGVIIKCADGTIPGKLFKENILAARAAGMEVVGAYFWLYPTSKISASLQGNAWWNIVKAYDLDIFFADYEWTSWNGSPANPTWKDFLDVAAVFEKVSGRRLDVYSAPGYIADHPVLLGSHRLWIANYNTLKPNTSLSYILWQCSEGWPGEELGFTESKSIDGDICPLDETGFLAVFKHGAAPPPIKYHTAEGLPSDLRLTPSQDGLLSYRYLADLVLQNHWRAAMNAGAGGQDMGDKIHFQINGISAFRGTVYSRGSGWGTLYIDEQGQLSELPPRVIYTAIPYSRRAVLADGSIYTSLDTVKKAGWNLLGMRNGKLVMLVTEGVEGISGYTQWEAAAFVKSLGLIPAWLCDSGHPCNFIGAETYSAYGEPVQFAIGFTQGDVMPRAQELLGKTVTIRDFPSITGKAVGSVLPKAIINYQGIMPDYEHPGNDDYQWLQLDTAGTQFVNYYYPSVTVQHLKRFELLDEPTPPPPDEDVVILPSVTMTLPGGKVYEARDVKLTLLP